MSKRKAIVFFSAGLGDALLLVPMIKRLKLQGYSVSGLFNSSMPCKEMLANTGLLDEWIDANTRVKQLWLMFTKKNQYDLAVINYFAANRTNFTLAYSLAKKIISNRLPQNLDPKISQAVQFVEPLKGIHDAKQNLLLVDEKNFSLEDLKIPAMPGPEIQLPEKYVALQVSSGNEKVTYKNWPLAKWNTFFSKFAAQEEKPDFVLLGNQTDIPLANELRNIYPKITSLAGKTSITQAMQVLSNCQIFLGLDSGLMHLAVAFGKPTFTLWGASSEMLYGYEQFDPNRHKCIRSKEKCFPCNAWIEPNQSRTISPENCPDNACMQKLDADEVYQQFIHFVNSLPKHVS